MGILNFKIKKRKKKRRASTPEKVAPESKDVVVLLSVLDLTFAQGAPALPDGPGLQISRLRIDEGLERSFMLHIEHATEPISIGQRPPVGRPNHIKSATTYKSLPRLIKKRFGRMY